MYKIIQTYCNVGDLQKVNSHDNGVKRFNSIYEAKEHLLTIKVNMTHWKTTANACGIKTKQVLLQFFLLKHQKEKPIRLLNIK